MHKMVSDHLPRLLRTIIWLTLLAYTLLFTGCGIPDLGDPGTLEEAKQDAIPLESLNRKLMYGMIVLYVDQKDEPYSGWVRENHSDKSLKTLGFLKGGQKFGLWLHWHKNQVMSLASEWYQDRLQGSYRAWHDNNRTQVIGQTLDGEMNGEWKEYYRNGEIRRLSHNQMGKLIWTQVWRPDGVLCPVSKVEDGNGTYCEYEVNGSLIIQRTFSLGVEKKKEEHSGN